ncbi:MAG: patatin-like phospholipase family protein [Nitrospirae bacterium]|nr:patatin-like phospholipase family protein [Nitrospirota bacterium]
MAYPFRNLIFEGGGVKGIAYAGAMEVLEGKGILQEIKRAGGTSAGAINAVLFGLNYTNSETKDILGALNFKNFLDDSWGVFRDTKRLINEFGVYKGDFFRSWIADKIKQKTGNSESTFKEIFDQKDEKGFRDIYMVGTNLSTRFSEIFSFEHTPRMPLADAIRISMSIPLFFTAKRNTRDDVYVDGGVLDNYPIKLFDRDKYIEDQNIGVTSRPTDYYTKYNEELNKAGKKISSYTYNKETLGFRLDSAEEIALFRDQAEPQTHKIDGFFSYAWGLIETIMENQSSQHLHNDDWHRTIYIDTLGVKTTDFDLADATKERLLDSGRRHTSEYFDKWYDNPLEKPANRV